MSETKTPKRIELSRADVIKCNTLLQEHLHKVEGTDLWKFDEGWDDQRIADEVGGTAGPHSTKVSKLRLELYGKVQTKLFAQQGNPELEAKFEARIAALEQARKVDNDQSDTLHLHLLATMEHYNRLINRLKQHHLGDFKDLLMEIPK